MLVSLRFQRQVITRSPLPELFTDVISTSVAKPEVGPERFLWVRQIFEAERTGTNRNSKSLLYCARLSLSAEILHEASILYE